MRTRLQYQGGYGGATATRISWHHAIIFNTFRGRIITKEKFDKLMTLLWEIMQLVTCSPQGMAKLRGKAQHQKRCIEGVRPFLVTWCALTCLSAGSDVYEWDKQQQITEELCHAIGFLYQHLPSRREEGAEMWPMQPCTFYYRWMRGLIVPYRDSDLVVAAWDAAQTGVAIAILVTPGVILRLEWMQFEGVSTIVTVTFEDTQEAQAHGWRAHGDAPDATNVWYAGPVGVAAQRLLAGIYALEKGSSSQKLHRCCRQHCHRDSSRGSV